MIVRKLENFVLNKTYFASSDLGDAGNPAKNITKCRAKFVACSRLMEFLKSSYSKIVKVVRLFL